MLKFCFDIDGVICTTYKNDYFKAKPKKKVVTLINNLYKKNYIILFTARYMGRNNDNPIKARQQGYKKTYKQLISWGLKFHELRLGKPSYDVFVDDKNFQFHKNWTVKFSKKYL